MTQEEAAAEMVRPMDCRRAVTGQIEDARRGGFRTRPLWRRLKSDKIDVVFAIATHTKRMQDEPGVKFKPACESAGMGFQEAYKHLWMLQEFETARSVRDAGIASAAMAMEAAAAMRRERRLGVAGA